MLGLGFGILLLCAVVWFVLLPILKPHADPAAVDSGADPEDDLSPRAVAMRALSEIEFDRATGKLSEGDYETLKARYTGEAVEAMRGEREKPAVPAGTPVTPLRRPSPKPQPTPAQACPVHGPRPEVGATYCSECGRRVGTQAEDRFCTKCGTLLEADSRFCGRCGSRVAA